MELRNYIDSFFADVIAITEKIDRSAIERMISLLLEVRRSGGRLFILGVGGSAANASHAVNDFRKIAGIETYAPTDNVSELTARVNDEGWETVFVRWLETSRLTGNDCLFVLSVGGGNSEKNISLNIVRAVEYALTKKAKVTGIVGRDGGYTRKHADTCVVIPPVDPATLTPTVEAFQSVVWHLIVSHPDLKLHEMKWESSK